LPANGLRQLIPRDEKHMNLEHQVRSRTSLKKPQSIKRIKAGRSEKGLSFSSFSKLDGHLLAPLVFVTAAGSWIRRPVASWIATVERRERTVRHEVPKIDLQNACLEARSLLPALQRVARPCLCFGIEAILKVEQEGPALASDGRALQPDY